MARDPRRRRRPLSLRRATAACVDSLEARTLMASTELITNGDFAANGSGWTLGGNWRADATYSTTNGRSNPGYAYLAINGSLAQSLNTSGSLQQTVTLPSTIDAATLSFHTKFSTEEAAGNTSDKLVVTLRDPLDNGVLATLKTINAQNNGSYVASSIDLSDFAGTTVKVSFDGSTDGARGTLFRLDDVSLLVEATPQPAQPLRAPTPVTPGLASGATANASTVTNLNANVATLRWNAASGAAGYGVQLVRSTGGPFPSYTTILDSEASTFPSPIKGTSITVPKALTAGQYRWRVRAFDASGNPTGYSPWLSFTVTTTGWNRAVGIDISHWQTVTNWGLVKTNNTSITTDDTSFIWAKATQGTWYTDDKYAGFVSGAAGAGIPLGAYHFAEPGSSSAAAQATFFYNTIKNRLLPGTIVPMLDFEDRDTATTSMGKEALSQWVNSFMSTFINLSGGIVPVLYVGQSYASTYLDSTVLNYPMWVAQYPTSAANPTIPITPSIDNPDGSAPWPTNAWTAWQYTSNRTVAGFAENLDSDVANMDVAAFYDAFKIRPKTLGSISGTLFHDVDSNGARDAGEDGLPGRTVWIDYDDNGAISSGEPTAITDANGRYTFTSLPEGAYVVRRLLTTNDASTTTQRTLALAAGIGATGVDFGGRLIDAVLPAIASADYAYAAAARALTLTLSEDVAGSLTAADLTLVSAAGVTVPFTFAYSAATRTATLTPTTPFANGSYRLSIAAGTFNDAVGNTNAAYTFDFFELAGDVNRDRATNFSDLLTLAKNYNTSERSYADGDLDGNGTVGFSDLLILAKHYNSTAPAMPAPAAPFTATATPVTRKRTTDSVLT